MMTNAITNEVINQTNCITNIIINNIIHKTNEITPVEIVNSGVDWVAIAQIATPFILVIWAGIDQTRKKKDTARKEEQRINEKIKEYKCILKKFIDISKNKIPPFDVATRDLLDNVINYNRLKSNLEEALDGGKIDEVQKLLVNLEIIKFHSGNYEFTNMPEKNDNESRTIFLKYLDTVIDKIDNGEYDDEIRKYIMK